MHSLHSIAELAAIPGPVVLAIGVFDGVHLGHQAVIARALHDAKAVGGSAAVITFHPHPLCVTRPDHAPRLLTSTQHKTQLLKKLGVPWLLTLPFTRELAAMAPEIFIRKLCAACNPLREICVGRDWAFGKNRAGNLALLQQLGGELGFDAVGIPAVEADGAAVSSTRIRAAVETGDFTQAARLLGREFTLLGTVVHGDQLGRTLGFPTANLSVHNEQFPPNGVYAVEATHRGRILTGVANLGTRPTIEHSSGGRVLELFIFDFDADIYSEDMEVRFLQFLRAEEKFANLDELKAQIARDVENARRVRASCVNRP